MLCLYFLVFLWNFHSSSIDLQLLSTNDDSLKDSSSIPADDIVDVYGFCFFTKNFKYKNAKYQLISAGYCYSSPPPPPPPVSADMALTWLWKTWSNKHYPTPSSSLALGNDMSTTYALRLKVWPCTYPTRSHEQHWVIYLIHSWKRNKARDSVSRPDGHCLSTRLWPTFNLSLPQTHP